MGQSIDQQMNGSWNAYLASPADFAGADDIITNLAKERQHGGGIITRIITSFIGYKHYLFLPASNVLFTTALLLGPTPSELTACTANE